MKCPIWLLWGLLGVVVVCLITSVILTAMVIDKVPMPLDHYYLKRPKKKEPFIPFYVMQKGQLNYAAMKKSKPESISTLQYEDDEFNYILRNVIYSNLLNQAGATGGKRITAKRTSIILKDGVFHLKHIVDIPQNIFGKYINVHVVFKITVKDGKENLEIISAKAGSLSIPDFILNSKMEEILKVYRGTNQEKIVQESIIDLRTDQKGIFVKYRPYVLKQNIKKVSDGATGVFLGQLGYEDE